MTTVVLLYDDLIEFYIYYNIASSEFNTIDSHLAILHIFICQFT